MKIAVDAMGGDFAPEAVVEGAIQAAQEYGTTIILVGQEDRVHQELAKYDTRRLTIEVKHASQVIDMHDQPSFALRRKRDSSMHGAIYLTRDGQADAAISAGNTGAGMAIGKVACRMLEGIDRPALATVLPNISGVTVVIDVGANVDCKPIHLLQFAVMGHVYAKEVFGIEQPRIGLLSIGEESSKGNVLTKEVFEPLSESPLNFIGNAEGRDVFNGRIDVVVCDGFIGNVVLKVSESLAKTMGLILKEGFTKNFRTKLGYLLVKSEMEALKKRTDYAEYGGAPLLGLNGVVIISHGRSKAKAIKNAIRVASESVHHHLNDQITETMMECAFDLKSRAKMTSFWRQFKKSLRHEADTSKERQEKKEETETQTQPPVIEPQLPASESKPEGPEQGKKSWWKFKELPAHENEQEKEPAKDIEISESFVQTQEIVQLAVVEDDKKSDQLQKKLQKPEYEKKHWWQFKDSKAHDRDLEQELPEKFDISGPNEPRQEPEQPQITDQDQTLELSQEDQFKPNAPEKKKKKRKGEQEQ